MSPETFASALERLATTLRQADGLPALTDFHVTADSHDEPLVIAETLDAYSWANHLQLYPLPNTATGEVQFRGRANDLNWALLYLPDSALAFEPSGWTGVIHKTQALKAVTP